MAVYVLSSVSLDFTQCVVVRAVNNFVVVFALSVVFYMSFQKVRLGSNVRLSIFLFFFLFVGSVVLLIVSLLGGGNSIVCVFEEFRIRLYCLVQFNMSCRYECTCCLVVFMFV